MHFLPEIDASAPLPPEPSVSIIGLGPGSWADLTLRAAHRLTSIRPLFSRMRADSHPVTRQLAALGHQPVSLEPIYLAGFGYWERYRFMADILVNAARRYGRAGYVVPGSFAVFERTSRLLLDRCKAEGISLDLVAGISSLDAVYVALRIDPADNLQLINAVRLAQDHVLSPDLPCVILGLASDELVCLTQEALLQYYPPEHPVTVIHAAGWPAPAEWRRTMSVSELMALGADADEQTTIYLPALGARFQFDSTILDPG